MVEAGTPGLRIGDSFDMAGGRGSFHSEVIFEDCLVPRCEPHWRGGQGFAMAMESARCRPGQLGRLLRWRCRQLLDLSIAHTRQRHQFGKPLAANQGLQWILADMEADVHTAEVACEHAARSYDTNPDRRTFAGARAKLIASEAAGRVADRAVQIFGGEGYRKDRPIERIWRELRGIRILEGTSEVMRQIIAANSPAEPTQARQLRESPMTDTTTEPAVVFDITDQIATITLNRPAAYNALNLDMADQLLNALVTCDDNPDVRAVVLTGTGKAFCSGGDIREMQERSDDNGSGGYLRRLTVGLHSSIATIARMHKPVLTPSTDPRPGPDSAWPSPAISSSRQVARSSPSATPPSASPPTTAPATTSCASSAPNAHTNSSPPTGPSTRPKPSSWA